MTEASYFIDRPKIDKFLNLHIVKEFIQAMSELDETASNTDKVAIAADIAKRLNGIQLAVINVYYHEQEKWSKHMPYIVAYASADLMFEYSYFISVLGNPPYPHAEEFGLTEKDIAEYQNTWKQAGIEPTLVKLWN